MYGATVTRSGRPRLFRQRRPLMVLLERRELVALKQRAKAAGVSASAFVRGLILKALGTSSTRKKERT